MKPTEFRGHEFPSNYRFNTEYTHGNKDLPDFGIVGVAVAYLPNDFDQVIVSVNGSIMTMHKDMYQKKLRSR